MRLCVPNSFKGKAFLGLNFTLAHFFALPLQTVTCIRRIVGTVCFYLKRT